MDEQQLPDGTPGAVLTRPSAQQVRDELAEMVVRDLRGPVFGDEEQIPDSPRDWYVLGRLAPAGSIVEPETQDELSESDAGDATAGDHEPQAPSVPSLVPSSLGFTARVDAAATELVVTASWGRYENVQDAETHRGAFRRVPMSGTVIVPLAHGEISPQAPNRDAPAVVVRGRVRRHQDAWLVTLFLVNAQEEGHGSRNWVFQAELSAAGPLDAPVFLPRLATGAGGGDAQDKAEQRSLAMAYRFLPEFAVGHGTGVHVEVNEHDPKLAVRVTSASAPSYELPATDVPSAQADPDLPELADLVLDMQELATLGPDGLRDALTPLLTAYRGWIERSAASITDPDACLADFEPEARAAIAEHREAADRIEAGIKVLSDAAAFEAFRFANSAMHQQRVHTVISTARSRDPQLSYEDALHDANVPKNRSWRPFQLAFLLLNLPALVDPGHRDRAVEPTAVADLLWFPTGGGKTEAYLGLTAFTMAIRRLQPNLGGYDARHGIAVLMRYTLRLLTIQQFQRAAALVCACEVLRRQDVARWGAEPFRIGMWVGGEVTPNRVDQAEDYVRDLRRSTGRPGRGGGSPHQLTHCPWCGSAIDPGQHIVVDAKGLRRTWTHCPDVLSCPFGVLSTMSEVAGVEPGLPVVVADEEVYRVLPSLVIATVDKFAQLPWQGQTRALFGGVDGRCERHGFVTAEMRGQDWEAGSHQPQGDLPAASIVAAAPVRPPDLIVQDELHLIAGPLGSLVGLYEAAIDKLATWNLSADHPVRPKVIASTATVRRAPRQIGALFDRATRVFPPRALVASDTFFARQRPTQGPGSLPGRRYVGLCAQGVRTKSTFIRVYVALLAAAQQLHTKYGANEVTDPYMTLVGYFNALRDLGGMRRLVEDDVSTRLGRAAERGLANRSDPKLRELTSRMSSDQLPAMLRELERRFTGRRGQDRPVDVLLATNMIAVGVDISRLGVMVVANQPKSTAEYIQATSRVGRSAPGLVFTVFNWARPRDLSHYETFEAFHTAMYRYVEALSVTPFADRAIDRGLSGVFAGLVRDAEADYNANVGAAYFRRDTRLSDHLVQYLRRRATNVTGQRTVGDAVVRHLEARIDHWERRRREPSVQLGYRRRHGRNGDDVIELLHDPNDAPWHLMTCPTSLRNVEPGIRLILTNHQEGEQADEPEFTRRPDDTSANGTDATPAGA